MEKQQLGLLRSRLLQEHRQVEVDVALTRAALLWRDCEGSTEEGSGICSSPGPAHCRVVQVCDIIAVCKTKDDVTKCKGLRRATPNSQLYPHGFTVSHVKRAPQHQWRCSDVTFRCASLALCEQWVRLINEQLELLTDRPGSLLVYINPFGGKRRGKSIYEQKVAPLLRRAGIAADVIVTERANHARDHLKTEANLDKYDGVVCVGGDGMFSEVLHGLVTRTQTDHGVDQNQPDAKLVPCSLRIGIIPAGSTDCICFATVGTSDPVTSALHIIVGDSQPMDVCSVHHGDVFLRYSVSLLGYGFYGDMLRDSERMRWLGPPRYDLSGAKTFLSHNYYKGTVSFLPANEEDVGNPRDALPCRSGCAVCQLMTSSSDKQQQGEKEKSGKDDDMSWSVIRGEFIAINAASMSCACPRSPQGLSPSAHLADGTTDLILVRKCSRLDFFRHLFRHTNKDDQFDHSFVEVYRVKAFHFQPGHQDPGASLEDLTEIPPSEAGPCPTCPTGPTGPAHDACDHSRAQSCWSCDGEILPHAAIRVSVQCQLIRLFARGIEEQLRPFEDPCAPWAAEPNAH